MPLKGVRRGKQASEKINGNGFEAHQSGRMPGGSFKNDEYIWLWISSDLWGEYTGRDHQFDILIMRLL